MRKSLLQLSHPSMGTSKQPALQTPHPGLGTIKNSRGSSRNLKSGGEEADVELEHLGPEGPAPENASLELHSEIANPQVQALCQSI